VNEKVITKEAILTIDEGDIYETRNIIIPVGSKVVEHTWGKDLIIEIKR
jgi:hypothetical protein